MHENGPFFIEGWSGFKGKHKSSESCYMQNYSFELTNFSIFTSGSSIYHFPFSFFGIFNTDNFSGCPNVRGGKFPCGPSACSWRDNSAVDWTVSVYPPLLYEHSLILPYFLSFCTVTQPLSTAPDLNFHSNSLSPSLWRWCPQSLN